MVIDIHGPFRDFPYYKTMLENDLELVTLTPEQVNRARRSDLLEYHVPGGGLKIHTELRRCYPHPVNASITAVAMTIWPV